MHRYGRDEEKRSLHVVDCLFVKERRWEMRFECYALQGRLTSWIMRSGLDDKDAFAMVVLASVASGGSAPLVPGAFDGMARKSGVSLTFISTEISRRGY